MNWEQTKFEKKKKYKITAGWEKAKVFAPYILSAGVFLGSYFGYLEFQNSRRIIEIQNKNIELQTRNSIDQRFKDAIQLLGNENMGSRLGGIYALNNIAQSTRDPDSEYANYSESIFKILCSYIRDKTQDSNYQKKYKDKPSIEIQSIIDVIFKDTAQRVVYKKYRADLPSSYLVGADFNNAALEYADFSDASLDNAYFSGAQCQKANFYQAQCQGADFSDANLDATALYHIGIDDSTRFDKTSMKGASSRTIDSNKIYKAFIHFYRPTSIHEKDTLLFKRIKEEQKKGGVITGVLSDWEREYIFKGMGLPFDAKDSTSLHDWEYDSESNIVKKKYK